LPRVWSRNEHASHRIKICGLTREQDVDAAVALGADAIGLVFYPPSPRCVDVARAAALAARVPPFVTVTGLFVNAARDEVRRVLEQVPVSLLQVHGDETPADCEGHGRPYIRAARVRPGVDLLEFATCFATAQGLLLDAFVDGYGGGGQAFDWNLIPARLPRPLILSGGLDPANVATARTARAPVGGGRQQRSSNRPRASRTRRRSPLSSKEFVKGMQDLPDRSHPTISPTRTGHFAPMAACSWPKP